MPQQSLHFSCAFPKCSALPTVALATCVHASSGCDAFHAECFMRYCADNSINYGSAPMCYPCTVILEIQVDAEEDEALFGENHVDGGGAASMCKAGWAKAANNVQKLGAHGAADADSDSISGSLEAAALTPELTPTAVTMQPLRADDTAETVASPEAHPAGRATVTCESNVDAARGEADEAPEKAATPAQAAELSVDSGPAVHGKPRGPPPPQGSLVGSLAACIACGEETLPVVSGSTAHNCEGCGWSVHTAIKCARVCACRLRHDCMAQTLKH